jgi:hypothetical protein
LRVSAGQVAGGAVAAVQRFSKQRSSIIPL